ncbi:MAG: histidine phosphatase family protein, partial [Planctomycetaceae bacterium]|nr:histidine phosphatase family protein [Planctomycetaceae bacterium]
EEGIAQVQRARDFLETFPLSACFASPMLRAMQSAEIIAEPHGRSITPVEGLVEVHVGDWESKSWDRIMQEDPQHYEKFMADPAYVPYKNGESYQDVQQRVIPAFEQLAENNRGKMISVVAHNVVNRSYLAHVLGLDLKYAKDIRQNNACVNVLKYSEGKAQVVTLNGIFHLGEI